MKTVPPLLSFLALLLAVAWPAPCPGGTRPERAQPAGRQYLRLSDWARANQFTVRQLGREQSLQLSNRWARLAFNLDPRQNFRRAEINGVAVWLAFPLLFKNGAAYISQLDLEQTITPVLSPRTNPPGIKLKTICLDPGHGGKDPGFQIGSHDEKKYTLLLAQELRSQLLREGFNVVLTRSTDEYPERAERPAIAKKRNADLFVSLHFNSLDGPRGEVQGAETYCLTPAGATSTNAGGEGDTRWVTGNRCNDRSMLLAYQVHRALVKELAVEDRGVRRARWEVLREAQLPAILIEGGFMSHPVEGRKIFDPAYRRQMARAIVDGILAYKRSVKG
jgi:N-acetylmuramoyl-L-alanine amidase